MFSPVHVTEVCDAQFTLISVPFGSSPIADFMNAMASFFRQ